MKKSVLMYVTVLKDFPETGEVDVEIETAWGKRQLCVRRDSLVVLSPFSEEGLTDGWINLADQEPPRGTMLIVAMKGWYQSCYFARWDGESFWNDAEGMQQLKPTHWMLAPTLEKSDNTKAGDRE